jgi:hypothetical protein
VRTVEISDDEGGNVPASKFVESASSATEARHLVSTRPAALDSGRRDGVMSAERGAGAVYLLARPGEEPVKGVTYRICVPL